MTKTVSSNPTSYLPALEFLKRWDPRAVADLISDDGNRVGDQQDDTVNLATVAANANLAAALLDASGELEAACLLGKKYSADDLNAILLNPCAGQAKIYRILTDLTAGYLVERRPDLERQLPASFERSMAFLEQVCKGERIFGFTETAAAGLLEVQHQTPLDIERQLSTTFILRGWLGRRSNRFS